MRKTFYSAMAFAAAVSAFIMVSFASCKNDVGGGDNNPSVPDNPDNPLPVEKVLESLVVSEAQDSTPSSPSFAAKAIYSDKTETLVTEKAVWSSSAESVATVNSGKVTLVSEGETVVTATYSDGSKSATSSGQRIKVSRENGEDGSSVKDKIIVHVPVSLGYEYVWAWNPADTSDNYTGGSWGGQKMSDADGDGNYDYTLNKAVSAIIFNENRQNTSAGNGQTYDLYITAGEWDYIGGKSGTEDKSGEKISSNFKYTEYKDSGTLTATITPEKNPAPNPNPNPSGELVSDWNELRIYQVMVSSFQDGDPSIGYSSAYGPNGALTGGDLQGIINAIPYIKELGLNAIWMTPIFNSSGKNGSTQLDSTGYYTYDYFDIDPNFGTVSKFQELVDTAHENGINVILDGVVGHWSRDGVKASPSGKTPKRSNGQYKGCDYPESLEFFQEVLSYWITNYRIDGWRLDQAYQAGAKSGDVYTGNKNYWPQLCASVESAALSNGTKGEAWGTLGYMVGEVLDGNPANIQNWVVAGDGLQSCFDFPSRYKLCQAILGGSDWANSAETITYADAMSYTNSTYSVKGYTHSKGYYPNLFFCNHDLLRFGDLIINWKKDSYGSNDYVARYKIALASLAAYTGPITLYYGDEWGEATQGISLIEATNKPIGKGSYWDNSSRTTGRIDKATNGTDAEKEVLSYTKALMKMRSEHEALWNGSVSDISSSGNLYAVKKTSGTDTVYVAINNGTSSASFNLPENGTNLFTGEKVSSGSVIVSPLSSVFIGI